MEFGVEIDSIDFISWLLPTDKISILKLCRKKAWVLVSHLLDNETSAAHCTSARLCQTQIVSSTTWRTERLHTLSISHGPALMERRHRIIGNFNLELCRKRRNLRCQGNSCVQGPFNGPTTIIIIMLHHWLVHDQVESTLSPFGYNKKNFSTTNIKKFGIHRLNKSPFMVKIIYSFHY